jgi:hypothetical protein
MLLFETYCETCWIPYIFNPDSTVKNQESFHDRRLVAVIIVRAYSRSCCRVDDWITKVWWGSRIELCKLHHGHFCPSIQSSHAMTAILPIHPLRPFRSVGHKTLTTPDLFTSLSLFRPRRHTNQKIGKLAFSLHSRSGVPPKPQRTPDFRLRKLKY